MIIMTGPSDDGLCLLYHRFKSPYICFSIEMRDEIKKELPPDAKVRPIKSPA
jgi:hypothetical protein